MSATLKMFTADAKYWVGEIDATTLKEICGDDGVHTMNLAYTRWAPEWRSLGGSYTDFETRCWLALFVGMAMESDGMLKPSEDWPFKMVIGKVPE